VSQVDEIKRPGQEDIDASQAPLMEHLVELRKRLIYSLVAVFACFIVCFAFAKPIYNILVWPYWWAADCATDASRCEMIYTAPHEYFFTQLKLALFGAVFLAFPVIASQLYKFIAPGLYSHEKKLAVPFVALSSICFIGGAAFAHYVVFPLTWKFFGSFSSDLITFMPRIEPAFGLYMKLVLVFGAVFQMPTLVLFLARLGIVTARFLVRNMKYAILIMFVVGAVLSPGTDPVGQILLAGPMFVLYLISIALAWIFGKKKKPLEAA